MTLSLVRDSHPGFDKLDSPDYGTTEWHTSRSMKLGGSEIAAILGLSQWASYYSTFCKKMGVDLGDEDSEAAYWGRATEAAIQDRFEQDHPEYTLTRNPGRYVRKDRRWQLASPDGILARDGFDVALFEAKTAMYADGWGRPGMFDVPPGYRAQVLWYLDVLGLRQAWLAVKIGAFDYREYFLDLDTDAEAAEDLALLLERGEQFIDRLQREDWPTPDDGSDVTYQAVRWMHPDIEDVEVEVPAEVAGEYLAAEIHKDEAEARFNAARCALLEAMGTAKHAVQEGDERRMRFAYRTARSRNGEPGKPYPQTTKRMKQILTIQEAGAQ